MASLVVAKIVNVCVPFLLKRSIDALSLPASRLVLPAGLIVAYAAARVLQQAFGELRDFAFARVSQHAQRAMGLETFCHLHRLSLRFHLDRQTGGLSRAIERGTRGIQTVLQFLLFNIGPTIVEVALVAGILAYRFAWPFAAITVATVVAYVAFTLLVTDWRVKYRRAMNQRDGEANTKAIDSLLNFETVKYFGNEEHERARFDEALAGYEDAATQSQTSLTLLNLGQGVIIGIGLAGLMWLAAQGVVDGRLTPGDFVLVNAFLLQLYAPLNFLGFVYRETKQSLIDMDNMLELLRVDPDVRDKDGAPSLELRGGDVEFDRVSFGYGPGREILRGVSFRVPRGKSVAIVGPSGAGKSTIGRLIFRFYDVASGAIRVDGQDVRDVRQASLRQAIGIVPQDTVLFNETIGYNIRYGRPSASDEAAIAAAKLAKIHDFVESLPQGYATGVGERGLKLSGGEKQRVAIARAILKGPEILLFDEATSALDSRTERAIQESLRDVSRDRTTIVIAHRLSTVVDADEILVLKAGEIVERGRHRELLAAGGEYAEMWARQAEARAAEETLARARSSGIV
jgi:ATP-binding cassette subfamily B protein